MNSKSLRPQSLILSPGNPARWISAACCATFFCIAPASRAATLSVVDPTANAIQSSAHIGKESWDHVGGFINGTVFERGVPIANSGQFRVRFELTDDTPADLPGGGYKTGGVTRSKSPAGRESLPRVQDSAATAEGGSYKFSLLANGSSRRKIKHLSLDMFGIQMGGVTAPVPLPASQTGRGPRSHPLPGAAFPNSRTSQQEATAEHGFTSHYLSAGPGVKSAHYTLADHQQSEAPRWMNAGGSPGGTTLQVIQPALIPEPGVTALAVLGGILTLTGRRRGR